MLVTCYEIVSNNNNNNYNNNNNNNNNGVRRNNTYENDNPSTKVITGKTAKAINELVRTTSIL